MVSDTHQGQKNNVLDTKNCFKILTPLTLLEYLPGINNFKLLQTLVKTNGVGTVL